MTNILFNIFVSATWQSLLLAVGVLFTVLMLGERLQPRYRYMLWCIVLLRLALPILPSTPWGFWSESSPAVSQAETSAIPEPFVVEEVRTPMDSVSNRFDFAQPMEMTPVVTETNALPEKATASLRVRLASLFASNWKQIVLAVWLVGVAILAIRYGYDELRLFRRSRYWKPVDDSTLLALVERCRKEIGVQRRVELLSVSHGIGAAAAGLFRPKILISEQAMAYSPEQLRMVFLHEMVHIRRFDPFLLRLATILSLIHWPNPAVWFAVSRLQRERELACDAAVLDKLGSTHRKEYGQAVLAFAELFSARERLPGLVGVFQKNNIIRRIDMILKHQKYKISHAILGILLVLAVAGFGLTKAQTPKPQEQGESTQQGIDFPIPELETELLNNTQTAYQKAYDAVNGDITTGTAEQKEALIWQTTNLANLYRQQDRMDEALRLVSDCKRYVSLLEKETAQTENKEDKEGLLNAVAQTYATFAEFGMVDDAVAAAKLSPETRQYNASEYLTKTARIIASREGLDKAVPILDIAIVVAKKLPEPFWRECGIIEVAEVYEEAGRSPEARALIDSLPADGKVRGLLALFNVLRKKKKAESILLPLLQESERIAEQIDDTKERSSRVCDISYNYILLDRLDEAKKLFEKSGLADDPEMRDEFQSSLAYHWIEQGKYAEAETAVEKLESPKSKAKAARVLMRILQELAIKSDIPTMKRLIPIVEPHLVHLETFAHRLHHQLYLAAYKMQVGDMPEGRKMMDDLIAGPTIEGLTRDESISRAVGGLCYAGLYDEARKKAETISNPAARASVYESIKAIYLQNEKPEEYKKRFLHEVREETLSDRNTKRAESVTEPEKPTKTRQIALAMPETTDMERFDKIAALEIFYADETRKESIRIAKSINDPALRVCWLLKFARYFADKEKWDEYVRIIETLDSPLKEIGAAYREAWKDIATNNPETARKRMLDFEPAIAAMTPGYDADAAVVFLGVGLAKLGFFDDVVKRLVDIFSETYKMPLDDAALAKKMQAFLSKKNAETFSKEEKTHIEWTMRNAKSSGVLEVGEFFIHRKENEKAFDFAAKLYAGINPLRNPPSFLTHPAEMTMGQIVQTCVLNDDLPSAIRYAEKMKQIVGESTQWVMAPILKKLLEKGDFDAALKIARNENSFNSLVQKKYYVDLMEDCLKRNDKKRCADLLDEALQQTAKEDVRGRLDSAFYHFAEIAVKLGDSAKLEQVLQTAKKYLDEALADNSGVDESGKVYKFCNFAHVQSASGKSEDAKKSLQEAILMAEKFDNSVKNAYERDRLFNGIARVHEDCGFVEEAFQTVTRISRIAEQTEAYWAIGLDFLQRKDFVNARRALKKAQDGVKQISDPRILGLVYMLEQQITNFEKLEAKKQSETPQKPQRQQGTETTLTIRGTVIDETKNPVAGADVYSYGTGKKIGETDRKGEYSIVSPEGNYIPYGAIIVIDKERKQIGLGEYIVNSKSKTVHANPITLYPARTITGNVVDSDGRPAPNVMVAGCDQTTISEIAKTNEKGEFSFLYPSIQPLQLVYAYQTGKALDFVPTEELPSFYGETPKSLIKDGPFVLKLRPVEPFKIRVVDESGKPIAGATVAPWLIENPVKPEGMKPGNDHRDCLNTDGISVFKTLTDAEGFATVDSVPADFLKDSTFHAYGFREMENTNKIRYGSVSKSWKELTEEAKSPIPTLVLPRLATVNGTVKLEDGTPVPKVKLTLRYHEGSCGSSFSDENGNFTFGENANTLYNINIDSDKGAAPAIFNYNIGDGTTEKRLDIVLKKGIRLHGKVYAKDGKPAKVFHFTLSELDPNPPQSFKGDSPEKRSRFVYGINRADRYFGPRNGNTDGDYETLISTEPREYSLNVSSDPQSDGVRDHQMLKVKGNEKEIRRDYHFGKIQPAVIEQKQKASQTEPEVSAKDTVHPLAGTAESEKSPQNGLRGFVVDAENKPVVGAVVRTRSSVSVISDENGRFQFPLMQRVEPSMLIFAAVPGTDLIGSQNLPEVEEAAVTLPEIKIVLKKGRRFFGDVVDENGKPVAGAYVGASGQSFTIEPVTTDEQGKFEFYFLQSRTFDLYAVKPGIGFDFVGLEMRNNTTVQPPLKQENGPLTLTLTKTDPISFHVEDESGNPLEGVNVAPWLIGKSGGHSTNIGINAGSDIARKLHLFIATTDRQGNAVIDWLPKNGAVNEFHVYGERGEKKAIFGLGTILAKPGESAYTLKLSKQVRIDGSVRLPDGTPVPFASLSFFRDRGNGWIYADQSGNFSFSMNPHEKIAVGVLSTLGAAPTAFDVDAGDGSKPPRIDFVLQQGTKVFGSVLAGPDKKPYPTYVYFYESYPNDKRRGPFFQTVRVDADGNYETRLSSGKYEVNTRLPRLADNSSRESDRKKFDIGTETERRIDFYFPEIQYLAGTNLRPVESPETAVVSSAKKGSTIVFTFRDEDGKACEGVKLFVHKVWTDAGRKNETLTSDKDGKIVFDLKQVESPDSSFRGSVFLPGHTALDLRFHPKYGTWPIPETFDVKMERGRTIGGRVVDENGKPISGAIVEIDYPGNIHPEKQNPTYLSSIQSYANGKWKTDADGKWSCDLFPQGFYIGEFRVSSPGYAKSEQLILPLVFPGEIKKDLFESTYTARPVPPSELLEKTLVTTLKKGITIRGKVVGHDGKPVEDAKITVTNYKIQPRLFIGGPTNKEGNYVAIIPKPMEVNIGVWAKNLAPEVSVRNVVETNEPFDFQLKPGKSIRFRIVDTAGKPLKNVMVVVETGKEGLWLGNCLDNSNDEGRIAWNGAPEETIRYTFRLSGYQILEKVSLEPQDEEHVVVLRRNDEPKDEKPLQNNEQKQPGAPKKPAVVRGRVTDPDGKPVQGAILVWNTTQDEKRENRQKAVRTDKEGRYVSPPLPSMKGTITVIAEGFAPDMTPVDFATEKNVDFSLKKGELLQIRVVDQNGDPIPDVDVTIGDLPMQPWRIGANIFSGSARNSLETKTGIPLQTDKNGLYRWTWAPADPVGFWFNKNGYEMVVSSPRKPDTMFTAGKKEYTVVMRKGFTIYGTIIDNETGKPIPRFRFYAGTVVGSHPFFGRVSWQKNHRNSSGMTNGKFEHLFSQYNDRGYVFNIEADGYEAYVSPDVMPDETNPTFEVRLKKSDGVSGTVLLPDGSPAAGAVVYLAESGAYLGVRDPMENDYLRRTVSVAKTDAGGRFTLFNDQKEPYAVYVEHPKGLAWVNRDDFVKDPKIKLRGFAKLELVLPKSIYTDPEDEFELQSDLATKIPGGADLGGVKYTGKLVDGKTRYTFKSAVAGKYMFVLERMKPRADRTDMGLNHVTALKKPFELKEGETKTLDWSDLVP